MDLQTLHVEHAVLLGLFTALTVVNSSLHRRVRGAVWFPVFTFYLFLGSVLIALRGMVPTVFSVVMGGFFFPLAFACLHRSITEFFGLRRYLWRLQVGLAGGMLVWLVVWGIVWPHTAFRLIGLSLVLATQLTLTAVVVVKGSTGPLRLPGTTMAVLLASLALNYVVRAVGVAIYGVPRDYFSGTGLHLSLAVLVASVLEGGVVVAYVWFTTAELRHDLETQAMTDPLTHLMNRRAIELAAEKEIALARVTRRPLSAIMIDLDDFKQINDSMGHSFGDSVLKGVARCLQHELRRSDFLARLGGDEFVVLLPGASLSVAKEMAERLRDHLAKFDMVSGETRTRIRASFGVSELRGTTVDWGELMMSCDRALYSVKDVGGNQVLTL